MKTILAMVVALTMLFSLAPGVLAEVWEGEAETPNSLYEDFDTGTWDGSRIFKTAAAGFDISTLTAVPRDGGQTLQFTATENEQTTGGWSGVYTRPAGVITGKKINLSYDINFADIPENHSGQLMSLIGAQSSSGGSRWGYNNKFSFYGDGTGGILAKESDGASQAAHMNAGEWYTLEYEFDMVAKVQTVTVTDSVGGVQTAISSAPISSSFDAVYEFNFSPRANSTVLLDNININSDQPVKIGGVSEGVTYDISEPITVNAYIKDGFSQARIYGDGALAETITTENTTGNYMTAIDFSGRSEIGEAVIRVEADYSGVTESDYVTVNLVKYGTRTTAYTTDFSAYTEGLTVYSDIMNALGLDALVMDTRGTLTRETEVGGRVESDVSFKVKLDDIRTTNLPYIQKNFTAADGSVAELEFDVYTGTTTDRLTLSYLKVGGTSPSPASIQLINNGSIAGYTYSAMTWYTVKFSADTLSDRYTISVYNTSGNLLGQTSGSLVTNGLTMFRVSFASPVEANGYFVLDDLSISLKKMSPIVQSLAYMNVDGSIVDENNFVDGKVMSMTPELIVGMTDAISSVSTATLTAEGGSAVNVSATVVGNEIKVSLPPLMPSTKYKITLGGITTGGGEAYGYNIPVWFTTSNVEFEALSPAYNGEVFQEFLDGEAFITLAATVPDAQSVEFVIGGEVVKSFSPTANGLYQADIFTEGMTLGKKNFTVKAQYFDGTTERKTIPFNIREEVRRRFTISPPNYRTLIITREDYRQITDGIMTGNKTEQR